MKKSWKVLVMAFATTSVLAGCGSGGDNYSSTTEIVSDYDTGAYYEQDSFYAENSMESDSLETVVEENVDKPDTSDPVSERKLIKTVNMEVETTEYDTLLDTVETRTAELGGYIESLESYNGSSYSGYHSSRYASVTIRIPRNQLDVFLTDMSALSNVVSRNESVEDVTLSYVDMESHKEALQTEYDRLLVLLDNADTIEDIITIENRLSDVRYQIESMESQLRTYDNKINYSTIYLSIDEVEIFTPVKEETTWDRISSGFINSIQNISRGFREFFVGLIIVLPYLIVMAVIVLLIVFVVLFFVKKSQKKQAAKMKAYEEWQRSMTNGQSVNAQPTNKQ